MAVAVVSLVSTLGKEEYAYSCTKENWHLWKCLRRRGLSSLLKDVSSTLAEEMPNEWRLGEQTPENGIAFSGM